MHSKTKSKPVLRNSVIIKALCYQLFLELVHDHWSTSNNYGAINGITLYCRLCCAENFLWSHEMGQFSWTYGITCYQWSEETISLEVSSILPKSGTHTCFNVNHNLLIMWYQRHRLKKKRDNNNTMFTYDDVRGERCCVAKHSAVLI